MKKTDFFLESYTISSEKIHPDSGEIRFCFLSDLHGRVFGEHQEKLTRAIDAFSPDGILVGGDMVIGKKEAAKESMRPALDLLENLGGRYPVWYAAGNHEHRMRENTQRYGGWYPEYEASLESFGVTMLHNESADFSVRGSRFRICGLELEEAYYQKPFSRPLTVRHMEKLLGKKSGNGEYQILLAHHPGYGDTYFGWGADLILSGHYHGGLLRFSRRRGLISPQFHPFPRYCCGDFDRGTQKMLVSAGLGEHTFPLRIHNPRVLLRITVIPARRGR